MSNKENKLKLYIPVVNVAGESYILGAFTNLNLAHDAVKLSVSNFIEAGNNKYGMSVESLTFTIDVLAPKRLQ